LKKVDAHVIQPEEYQDAPELTDAQLANATVTFGIRLRGRPKSETRKAAILPVRKRRRSAGADKS
jgi:hypothetical protein